MLERIQRYIQYLSFIECYSKRDEMSIFPDLNNRFKYTLSVTRCTSSAMMIADMLGGKVYGYEIMDANPESTIGYWSQGHDFAVIGPYLVDWWAEHVDCCGKAILDMRKPDDILYIQQHYLPLGQWKEIPLSEWLR